MVRPKRRNRGFTLTELLITLAIASVLAMIGAPAMGSLLARTRDASTEASIARTLQHARNTAVMHNARVLVCPSGDGQHCEASDNWQHGWIVARDADGDGKPDPDTPIIDVRSAMPVGTRVITSGGRTKLTFHATGSAAGSNVAFTVCHARAQDGKAVILSNTGRVRLAKPEPERLQACLDGLP